MGTNEFSKQVELFVPFAATADEDAKKLKTNMVFFQFANDPATFEPASAAEERKLRNVAIKLLDNETTLYKSRELFQLGLYCC